MADPNGFYYVYRLSAGHAQLHMKILLVYAALSRREWMVCSFHRKRLVNFGQAFPWSYNYYTGNRSSLFNLHILP